ncbi:MAG: DUF4386 family protein, partial [Holophaga sp.]
MIGSSWIKSFLDGGAGEDALIRGFILEMLSGVAIVAIGLLMYPLLKQVDKKLGILYPLFRIMEFLASAALGIYLVQQLKEFPDHLLWVYLPTALGGLILTYLLFISRLVPKWIAAIGFMGYVLLLLGVPLGLLDIID